MDLLVISDPLNEGHLDDAILPACIGPQHDNPSQIGGHCNPFM